MNVGTIATRDRLAGARVLARSLAEHHPGTRLQALLVDDPAREFDAAGEPFDLVRPDELDLPQFEQMAGYYDALELTCSLKPWLLRRMLRAADHAIYLDSDIRLYRSCPELAEHARAHQVVLTPHLLSPIPRDTSRPTERDILIAGTFNLGFIAVGRGARSEWLLDWWSERLLTDCRVEPATGLLVDQRWIDLVPGMIEGVGILRDPTLNVGYWDLPGRELTIQGDGTVAVNGSALGFFHFSGYDPAQPERLSGNQDRIALADHPVLRATVDEYGRLLQAEGHADCSALEYAYARTAGGRLLDLSSRRLYGKGCELGQLSKSLFTIPGEEEFEAWAAAPGDDDGRITRYMEQMHRDRADLQAAFGPLGSLDAARYIAWATTDGAPQLRDVAHLIAASPDAEPDPAALRWDAQHAGRAPRANPLSPPVVVVDGVSKTFDIPHEQVHTFKERALHPFRKRTSSELRALRNVSFAIPKGSFYGIVGRNGSGKSTMLKCLAGIYGVDKGAIYVDGRMSTFIELGVGFNPDLAAYDNVLLNGAMMGLSRKEAKHRFDSIIEFAELQDYLDLKIKNYSSGMLVRLAFSVMIHVDAEILLIDEVLAVGDAAFQQKCYDEFERIRGSEATVLFVTHDMDAVNRFCDQALLLERGKVAEIGAVEQVSARYLELNFSEEARHEYDEPVEAQAGA